MPLPFLVGAVAAKLVLGAAVATGVAGVAKGVQGAVNTSKANDVQSEAESILDNAKYRLENKKNDTSNKISDYGKLKLEIYSNDINDFINSYSKLKNIRIKDSIGIDELSKLSITSENLKSMRETSLKATEILTGTFAGAGAGVLLGWGTYGSVMALGTAGTGTAIGTLSGAAATNATLAWLGGGTLAAGGGGMALGGAVLGGLVAGPALLLAGGLFNSKAKEKLNNAYSNLAEAKRIREEINTAIVELESILARTSQLINLTNNIREIFIKRLSSMINLTNIKTDWRTFTAEEKYLVATNVKLAQALKMLIDTPLLSNDGELTEESFNILNDSSIRSLLIT